MFNMKGGFNPDLKPKIELGQKVQLKVVAFGKSDTV